MTMPNNNHTAPSKDNTAAALALCGPLVRTVKQNFSQISIDSGLLKAQLEKSIRRRVSDSLFRDALNELSPIVAVVGNLVYPSPDLLRLDGYFDARNSRSRRAKIAVAKHVHENMLNRLDAVFIDAGSACAAICTEMAWGQKGHFTIMTNNMRAVPTLIANRTIRIFLTGGSYNVEDEALVGKGGLFNFHEYSFRYAIVGASGISRTHVFNHGIIGEEEIKKMYWQIPASELIVPATLEKFASKDICCFGALSRRENHPATGAEKLESSIYDLTKEEVESLRDRFNEVKLAAEGHREAPSFAARRCTIVIEPEWMIESNEEYNRDPTRRDELLSIVHEINENTEFTKVRVVFAEVDKKTLPFP